MQSIFEAFQLQPLGFGAMLLTLKRGRHKKLFIFTPLLSTKQAYYNFCRPITSGSLLGLVYRKYSNINSHQTAMHDAKKTISNNNTLLHALNNMHGRLKTSLGSFKDEHHTYLMSHKFTKLLKQTVH